MKGVGMKEIKIIGLINVHKMSWGDIFSYMKQNGWNVRKKGSITKCISSFPIPYRTLKNGREEWVQDRLILKVKEIKKDYFELTIITYTSKKMLKRTRVSVIRAKKRITQWARGRIYWN